MGKGAKNAAVVSSDEEESEMERLMDDLEPSRPPRRSGRNRPENPTDDEDTDIRLTDAEPTTPKPRPRPRATYKTKSPKKTPVQTPEASPVSSAAQSPIEPDVDDPVTPKPSRKRARSEEAEEGQSDIADGRVEGAGRISDPTAQLATPAGDMKIRRKRVRH